MTGKERLVGLTPTVRSCGIAIMMTVSVLAWVLECEWTKHTWAGLT